MTILNHDEPFLLLFSGAYMPSADAPFLSEVYC